MPDIILGDGFALDANIATKRTVLLGQPESGKTNGATVIAEGLLKLGVPVTVLDWKGDLWGMRSSADGERAGFPVVIFGGDHADVEVTEHDGREIGHLVAKDEMPSVIDCSAFVTDAERRRFYTAFLKAFLHAKKDAVRPHTLLIDEFQEFAPQRPYGEGIQLLGATQQLAGLGRKRGIGIIGTALRAAQLSKNFVEISDLYLFMQIAGKNDLQSIKDTIQSRASAEELKTILATLPQLQKGEVVAYSPAWLRILEQHRFRLRETFDSSRTPQVGETLNVLEPHAFAKIDVPALAARIEKTREQREAEDPEILRKRIAALETELKAKPAAAIEVEVEVERIVEKAILTDADRAHLDTIRDQLKALQEQHLYLLDRMGGRLDAIAYAFNALDARVAAQVVAIAPAAIAPPLERRPEPPAAASGRTVSASRPAEGPNEPSKTSITHDGEKITPACVRILEALAQRSSKPLSRRALGFLCGQSPKSSSYANNLAWLNARAYIRRVGDGLIEITSKGVTVAPVTEAATTREMHELWLPRFVPAQRRILDVLFAAWPKAVDRDTLAERAGASPTSSSFANNLAAMNSIGVIERVSGGLKAHDDMFPTGKAR